MIGRLSGVLVDAQVHGDRMDVCIDVSGLGYRVAMSPLTLGELGEVGSPVVAWIHTHVREDAMILYGFASKDERVCFEALIGAHGVGPSLALAILSTLRPNELRRAMMSDDVEGLCRVPGVGKKTAQRLLLDLNTALGVGDVDIDLISAASVAAPVAVKAADEVRQALTALGYSADETRDAIALASSGINSDDPGELLRAALRSLAVRR